MTTIEFFNLLSTICLVMFVIMLVVAIVLWIRLDVRHYLAILSGSEARKSIEKIRRDAESGLVQADRRKRDNRAVISWNTSGKLKNSGSMARFSHEFSNRMPLQQPIEATTLLDQPEIEATTILEQPQMEATMLLNPPPQPSAPAQQFEQTTLLDTFSQQPQQAPAGFVVEKEIISTSAGQTVQINEQS